MAKSITPKFIPWSELDFWNDPVVVQAMNWMQRHLYRALLLKAHVCATRPYLPDDDNQLWLLADAGNLKNWTDNKEPILQKFTREVIEGKPMLAHKRVLADWANTVAFYEGKREAGRRSAEVRAAQKSTGVERVLNKGQLTDTETESIEDEPTDSVVTDSATTSPIQLVASPLSQSQPSQVSPTDSVSPPTQSQDTYEFCAAALRAEGKENPLVWADRMEKLWHQLRMEARYRGDNRDDSSHDDFLKLLSPNWQKKAGFPEGSINQEEVELCLRWALLKSCRKDHPKDWGHPNVLDGSAGFVNAFGRIRSQCRNYHNQIKIKNQKIEGRVGSDPNQGPYGKKITVPFADGTMPEKVKPESDHGPTQSKPEPILPTEPETRTPAQIRAQAERNREMRQFEEDLEDHGINSPGKVKERMLSDRRAQLIKQGMSYKEAEEQIKKDRACSNDEIARMLGADKFTDDKNPYMVGLSLADRTPKREQRFRTANEAEMSDVADL